jgi:hypothetical protein
MSIYRVEIGTASCAPDAWSGNSLRFDSVDKAIDYAVDLYSRWTATTRWRVVAADGGIIQAQHNPREGATYTRAQRGA